MKADLNKLKELHAQGTVHAHNNGPTPETVIKLFETKPEIWEADLNRYERGKETHYSLPQIAASEKNGVNIMDTDIQNTIEILGEYFYLSDALKIQAGQEFGGRFRNRPPLIFLWWD